MKERMKAARMNDELKDGSSFIHHSSFIIFLSLIGRRSALRFGVVSFRLLLLGSIGVSL
jgi:hypothetical protein